MAAGVRPVFSDRHFAFANEFHHRAGLLLFAAHCHLAWAQALHARGQRVLAEQEAARALELAREHGYDGLVDLASVLLAPEEPISV